MYPQKKQEIFDSLKSKLVRFNREETPLRGLVDEQTINTFVFQIVDSIRRIQYVEKLRDANYSDLRLNPNSELFDPLKAAVIHHRNGNIDEAFWLIFLATHFGKSYDTAWTLCRDIYSALGDDTPWTWQHIREDFDAFVQWFREASTTMSNDIIVRKFSNHRKFESLKFDTRKSVPRVFRSYIDWIGGHGSHLAKFDEVIHDNSDDPYELFEALYKNMDRVLSFGRTGKFDYLTMIGKLQFLNVAPPKAYMAGATGPIKGANKLFLGTNSGYKAAELEELLSCLNDGLKLGNFGMQILEDALCNWQKNPNRYVYFSG